MVALIEDITNLLGIPITDHTTTTIEKLMPKLGTITSTTKDIMPREVPFTETTKEWLLETMGIEIATTYGPTDRLQVEVMG